MDVVLIKYGTFSDVPHDDVVLSVYLWDCLQVRLCAVVCCCSVVMYWYFGLIEDL